MNTIEDKIRLFSNSIHDKIKEEKQKEFERFEEEKRNTLDKLKKQLEERKGSMLREVMKRANLKSNEIVSAERMKNQQAVLKLKKDLINETISGIRNRLIDFTNSDIYHKFLIKEVKNTMCKLEIGEYIILLRQVDAEKYGDEILETAEGVDKISLQVDKAEDDIIGGFIIKSALGKFRINNSIAVKLEDYKGKVGLMVTERLGEEVLEKSWK